MDTAMINIIIHLSNIYIAVVDPIHNNLLIFSPIPLFKPQIIQINIHLTNMLPDAMLHFMGVNRTIMTPHAPSIVITVL
jgi:hypothetical protein